jgi:hypothetical protein
VAGASGEWAAVAGVSGEEAERERRRLEMGSGGGWKWIGRSR